ncbi:GIY-YIG nuclease family protein [Thalassotalea mangrovi]|uniref:GIY-YIG nuclease family protein n=1 Tax=Thalassotalea mangrovi TaxID=2572245 RepID=A0A4U1B842_9GAMM|nr:GIY-YIG nuclease family protein [Thalassotalea mangrovi]TKB46162.1 GIY-YIG nuclease family protein [Thalassotalea mangrovi]
MKQPAVYIITNTSHSVIYIGVTSNLPQRMYQHRQKLIDGFSSKYNLVKLVYFEAFDDMVNAITREKQLKKWSRSWKDELIGRLNPEWRDLYDDIL